MQAIVLLANPLNSDVAGAIVRRVRETAATRVQAAWRGSILRRTLALDKRIHKLHEWYLKEELWHLNMYGKELESEELDKLYHRRRFGPLSLLRSFLPEYEGMDEHDWRSM